MNYFAVHKQSNTIQRVISSSFTPTNTHETTFYPASDGRLNQYYARLEYDTPIDIYSIIAKPKTSEILPLTPEGKTALTDYVLKHRQHETTEGMALAWRVSERTIRDILSKLTTPLPLATLQG
ncbi:hypothetical protein QEM42_003706 [Pseudomonas putida]|uniref:hypothetical protein n=1 Tax=Pseudomonas TaxID=286 RepID=UPI00119899C6|nr:hypothetical protein [Pseudomonas putida]EKT4562506.1 hypothetical protein [Pseudomonas putida]MDP9541014.1 hypothetical protein [Pseudomonas putida]QDY37936.1 hypothetical protein CHR26_17395 [Pseudomonas putida]